MTLLCPSAVSDVGGRHAHRKVPRDADINRMLRAVVTSEKRRLKTFERALR